MRSIIIQKAAENIERPLYAWSSIFETGTADTYSTQGLSKPGLETALPDNAGHYFGW